MKIKILLIIIGTSCNLFGQSEYSSPQSLFQPGASPGSFGDAYASISSDPYATYYNPAGVAHSKYKYQFLINTQKFARLDLFGTFDQKPFYFVGGLWKIEDDIGIAFSVSKLSLNTISELRNNSKSNNRWINIAVGKRMGKKLGFGFGAMMYNFNNGNPAKDTAWFEQNALSFSFGIMIQDLKIHPTVGKDTSSSAIGVSFNGISEGVHSNLYSSQKNLTDQGDDPFPTNARVGISTVFVNKDYLMLRTSFEIRKVLVNRDGEDYDKWIRPFFTGWEAEDPTYHMGIEMKFPRQNFSFRIGRSSEKQFNPKLVRLSYGISVWYKSVEFIATIDNSDFDFDGEIYEHTNSRFELRIGIR